MTPEFDGWLARFFGDYYQRRPVNATFIGVHTYDAQLPACSDAALGDQLAAGQLMLDELSVLSEEPLSPAQRMDRRLAAGHLRIQRWELESGHFQRGNPASYMGEAIFGVISLFLRAFAPLPERVAAAAERLSEVARLLHEARANVRAAPAAWTEYAIRDCDGGITLLRDGLPLFCAAHGVEDQRLTRAAADATAALVDFQAFLRRELLPHDASAYACGEEALDLYLREGHQLRSPAAEVLAGAYAQLAESRVRLEEGAARFGAPNWRAALAQLAEQHPSPDAYYERYGAVWEAARAYALEHALLTWPEYPIRYVPRPAWTRAAAPFLYFLFYRSPAAFDDVAVVDYLVEPLEPDWPSERQEQLLRSVNNSVVKLNHVVHHGGIGHHVQNWHAFRSASEIGRMAAVDCASRIAMFCGGTMAEGWACYATELMGEASFLTELELYSLHHQRLRMAGRAIADIELHTNRRSLDEVIAFYRDEIGMPQPAARGEAVKNSMFPGTALMYLAGTDRIHDLRRELSARPGFSPRAFHDTLLSYGSVPVQLIAEAMRATTGDDA